MIRNPLIAQRLFNTPLLVHPAKLDAIIAGLGQRIGIDHYQAPEPWAFTSSTQQYNRDTGLLMSGDIAVMNIVGVLAHRGGLQADSSYILGYQTIARDLNIALSDPSVKGVVLNLDTPGGEVAGAFDLAAMIRDARGRKPIRAVAADMAASAGYLIGSAADSLAITQTGYVGSIGVVMRHVDLSQAMSNEGIKVSHIFAGSSKVDGNPYEPLPDAVRTKFQAEIDGLYALFVDAVTAQRGLTSEAVRATEAGIFRGQAAVDAGLADRVATPDQVIAELQAEISSRASARPITRGTSMSNATPEDAGLTQADIDKARAEGHAEGAKAGAEAERTRILGILTHAEAQGRTAQAIALAEAGLTAEQAAKAMAASPRTAVSSPFAAVMAGLNPAIGADAGGETDEIDQMAAGVIAHLPQRKGA
jgi:signal peptide peptidase SppA